MAKPFVRDELKKEADGKGGFDHYWACSGCGSDRRYQSHCGCNGEQPGSVFAGFAWAIVFLVVFGLFAGGMFRLIAG